MITLADEMFCGARAGIVWVEDAAEARIEDA